MPAPIVIALLVGAGVAAVAVATSDDDVKDDVDNPPRGKVWSDVQTIAIDLIARGWYSDVLTPTAGSSMPCGVADPTAISRKCGVTCFECDERKVPMRIYGTTEMLGEATPRAMPWRVDLGALDNLVVAADVRIVDRFGIVARTLPRTRKDTDGRKRGWLDVNEFTFSGPARETAFCERLARPFAASIAGPYLTRRRLPCSDLPATPLQTYTLYRAQRDTTANGPVSTTIEWFAKVRKDSPAYATRQAIGAGGSYHGLYNVRLEADNAGVYVAGEIAPSLAPQDLRVIVDWRTRAP